MNNSIKRTIGMLALLAALSLAACDGSDDKEKSRVEQFTDRTANEAVQAINEPMDRARVVQDLANEKAEEINRAAEQAAD